MLLYVTFLGKIIICKNGILVTSVKSRIISVRISFNSGPPEMTTLVGIMPLDFMTASAKKEILEVCGDSPVSKQAVRKLHTVHERGVKEGSFWCEQNLKWKHMHFFKIQKMKLKIMHGL